MPTLRETVQAKIVLLGNVKDFCDKAITIGNTWLLAESGQSKPRFDDIPETQFDPTAQEISALLTKANQLINSAKSELAKV